ncbi:DUF6850 family outer membrane beta-barrel protein [Sphingobacterium paucimobilis]|nr:DUF6850 family outer membrane beta-barrel protein [Sphingobacterium paucimobilis]
MSKKLIVSILMASSVGAVRAQTTAFELEKFKLQEVGLQSANASLLNANDFRSLGNTSVFYNQKKGDFKHPLLASESHFGGLETERFQELKNWRLYGKFGLDFGKDKKVSNTTQLDPLRLNPFIVVDSLDGDWNKQHYALETKIASPILNERLAFGLGIDYKVSTGARQRDPRPLSTSNTLVLTPSVTYFLNLEHAIGINGRYENFVEDLSVSNVNTTTVHNMYKLIGVGEYVGSSPTFIGTSSISRRYNGNKFGGALQYVFKGESFRFFGEGFVNHNAERAKDGSTNPQEAGKHEYWEYGANVEAVYNHDLSMHRLGFAWNQRNVDNIEYHQYQDAETRQFVTLFSAVFNTNLVTNSNVSYAFTKWKGEAINWDLGSNIFYSGWDNKYAVNQSQQTVDRLGYDLRFKKYFQFRDASAFAVELRPGYSHHLESKFKYDEKSYSTNFVANDILYPTNAYLVMDYFNIGASVQYTFKPSENNTQLYIKLSENYVKPTSNTAYFSKSQHRVDWQVAVGLLTF